MFIVIINWTTQPGSLPSACRVQVEQSSISPKRDLLFPAQEVDLKLIIVAYGDWTWKLERPGTHTAEMILESMVLATNYDVKSSH